MAQNHLYRAYENSNCYKITEIHIVRTQCVHDVCVCVCVCVCVYVCVLCAYHSTHPLNPSVGLFFKAVAGVALHFSQRQTARMTAMASKMARMMAMGITIQSMQIPPPPPPPPLSYVDPGWCVCVCVGVGVGVHVCFCVNVHGKE